MKYFFILFLVTKLNYAILCVNQNRAESGKLCRKWSTIRDDSTATPDDLDDLFKSKVKEITGHTDHNQCVNMYGFPRCYTTSWFLWFSTTEVEICHCHEESPNCKDISTTINGHRCQKWTSTAPHKPNSWMVASLHSKEHQVPNHNFCRATDPNDPKPWCYTTNPV